MSEARTSPVSPRPDPGVHRRAVRVLHTSDVHVGTGFRTAQDGEWPERAVADLDLIIQLGREQDVDLFVIAGDFFDHNRVRDSLVEATAEVLRRAETPIVVLPGNHDPYMEESVYVRCAHLFPANLHVIREAAGELISLPRAGVQVWGQAHTSYYDFAPAAAAPAWLNGSEPLWRVALAHGYYVKSDYETRFSYQIHPQELADLQAHYTGLGHLELHEAIGPPGTTAYYAGAPDRSGGATIVDLAPAGVSVRHVKAKFPPSSPADDHPEGAHYALPGTF